MAYSVTQWNIEASSMNPLFLTPDILFIRNYHWLYLQMYPKSVIFFSSTLSRLKSELSFWLAWTTLHQTQTSVLTQFLSKMLLTLQMVLLPFFIPHPLFWSHTLWCPGITHGSELRNSSCQAKGILWASRDWTQLSHVYGKCRVWYTVALLPWSSYFIFLNLFPEPSELHDSLNWSPELAWSLYFT